MNITNKSAKFVETFKAIQNQARVVKELSIHSKEQKNEPNNSPYPAYERFSEKKERKGQSSYEKTLNSILGVQKNKKNKTSTF